jgi:hypothetical protein
MKLFSILIIILSFSFYSLIHPLKMAYTAIKFNEQKQIFEVSQRVFQDDFEQTLQVKYAYNGSDVYETQESKITRNAIHEFFNKNFSMKVDGKNISLVMTKIEQKYDMGIVIHFESGKIDASKIKNIEIYNSIMMESFKEQVNMLNIKINDFSKTIKFEKNKTKAFVKY